MVKEYLDAKMSEQIPKEVLEKYENLEPPAGMSPSTMGTFINCSNKQGTVQPIPLDLHNLSEGRKNLRKWLGKTFRVVISDGRVLVGFFNCTDKDANVVLSMCAEYLEEGKDARILGNVMIPGKHIVSVSVDTTKPDLSSMDAPPPIGSPQVK